MAGPARQTQFQQTHYLRKLVNYNDAGVAAGVLVGTLPAGAIIDYSASVLVTTAFNAGTTNVLVVGTTAGGNDICATGVALAGATGKKRMSTADSLGPMSADTDVYVSFTETGTAASAGVAYILIPYIPNNDR